MINHKTIDAPSMMGQFGWERIGSGDLAIPVIIRHDVRYSPVRIVEQEIIKKYEAIPQAVFLCITLKSFYLTLSEAKLLNNINFNHCNNRYGEVFFDTKDVIISAFDVKELSRFLNITHDIFTQDLSKVAPKLGVIRLTLDPHDSHSVSLVPYIAYNINQPTNPSPVLMKFIPRQLVENFVVISPSSFRAKTSDWDIMKLKMLSVYCENNLQQFITRDTEVVLLEGLLYAKTNTPIMYEEYHKPATNWQTN